MRIFMKSSKPAVLTFKAWLRQSKFPRTTQSLHDAFRLEWKHTQYISLNSTREGQKSMKK